MTNLNLGALSVATTSAQALGNLILVTPENLKNSNKAGYQPQGKNETDVLGPKLLFHYEGENSVMLESDITDHYVEDNTAINDQIALRPESITVTGYIGELNNVTPDRFEIPKLLAEKLTIVNAYVPLLSAAALMAYNRAVFLYSIGVNAANAGIASWSSITNSTESAVITGSDTGTDINTLASAKVKNQNKQQLAFQQFYGYWRNRTLFTVQTPWAIFKNMAIKSLRATQTEETNQVSSFEVNFKIIRFASSVSGLGPSFEDASLFGSGRVKHQMQVDAEIIGPTTGSPSISTAQARTG